MGALVLASGLSNATEYHLGGSDSLSDYTWDGTDGVFSFANAPIGSDPNLPGFVSSEDIPGFDFTNVDGFGTEAQVMFNIMLGATQNAGAGDGVSAFAPTSTLADGNIKKAQFLGGAGTADMVIYAPVSGDLNSIATPLLTFDIQFIDVTNATKRTVDPLNPLIVIDPDGSITLGDATSTAVTSFLTVSGGTLAGLVGGVGAEARMSIIISTLTPQINTNADFRGFFGADWTSGIGPEPIAGLAFDMVIFPAAVPEPATATLLAFSLLGLAAHGRLRNRKAV